MRDQQAIKVLLIEDNAGDARLVRELLRETHEDQFQVSHVERLSEGLEQLRQSQFDVLLLDLTLPDGQGISTVQELQNSNPLLPIVVLSGLDDEAIALQAVQEGAQDYLVKGQGDGNLISRALRYAIERKRSEERLAFLAQYDPLTSLPNRVLYQDRLKQALKRAERYGNSLALMFLDLDHFKDINDTLGHDAGDELLIAVAKRIQACLRGSDTIARIGGDEFTVVLEGIADKHDVATLAQHIVDSMSRCFLLQGKECFVTASIGIALYPDGGRDAESLTKNADTALYAAKNAGRSDYQFYNEQMNRDVTRRMTMVNSLRAALERNEFTLCYQPIVAATQGHVVGMEVLLRWQRSPQNLVAPEKFVPLLEDANLIIPVGEWVLRKACQQYKLWLDAGIPELTMSVNLSACQFQQKNLVPNIALILQETGVDPSLLQLEITETALLDDHINTVTKLRALRNLGVQLAIDDFGIGYSSLKVLRACPLSTLKIDKSFIKDLDEDEDCAAIVSAVIDLGHSLRLNVIGEGVETEQQLRLLRQQRCDQLQGFLFAKPMSASAFESYLSSTLGAVNKVTPITGG